MAKRKTIEEKIEDILDECNEYYEGRDFAPGCGEYSFNTEKAIKKFKLLISDILREVIGEDDGEHITYSGAFTVGADNKEELEQKIREWERGIGYNRAKQEIHHRARKLGIKILKEAKWLECGLRQKTLSKQ